MTKQAREGWQAMSGVFLISEKLLYHAGNLAGQPFVCSHAHELWFLVAVWGCHVKSGDFI